MLRAQLKISILFTLITAVVFGILYPLAVTAIGQLAFPRQANGQLVIAEQPGHRLTNHRPDLLERSIFP